MPRRNRNTGIKPPFRLTKDSRTASFEWLNSLSEEDAYEMFKAERWRANGGKPFCPCCGSVRFYTIKNRPRWWKCAERQCRQFYSVTSGTIFHSRKLSFLKLLKITFHFVNAVKGMSGVQMHHMLDTQYTSSWVNMTKMREAMSADRNHIQFRGTIEIDGAYVGGHVRQENLKADRKDRRTAMKEKGMQRVLYTVTERGGKTVMFAADEEAARFSNAAIRALVPPDCKPIIISDGHPAYEDMGAYGTHLVVDHAKGFCVNGISTNRAEGSFSRLRRAEIGMYHHISARYLDFYGSEIAWRHNRRKMGNKDALIDLIRACVDRGVSKSVKGYWQHYKVPDDQLERPELRWERVYSKVYTDRRRMPKTQRMIS